MADIESEFKKYLQVLIPALLAPQNLVVKEISGQRVKAKELVQYFKSYIEIYKGDELPEPKSMLVVSDAFLDLLSTNSSYHSHYCHAMNLLTGNSRGKQLVCCGGS